MHLHTKLEVCSFSQSTDIEGSENLKVGNIEPKPHLFRPLIFVRI